MTLRPVGSNQTELSLENATILFSYKTPVAAWVGGEFFRTSKHWSKTTSRHINAWLEGRKAEEKPQEFFDTLVK